MKKGGKGETEKGHRTVSASFITGAIALVFLIVGFQAALFFGRVRQKRLVTNELATMARVMEADSSQTDEGQVCEGVQEGEGDIYDYGKDGRDNSHSRDDAGERVAGRNGGSPSGSSSGGTAGRNSGFTPKPKRQVENFRFNPNTVTLGELQRLGFSEKQAQSIENYRLKGGKFRRKTDFAKSFVVADSVYRRLESYIDIPLLDLNLADSAAFTFLPGIGGWFASKIVEYRERLGGYSYKEQLLDIYRFDGEKYAGLEDLICIDPSYTKAYPLWTLPEDSLALHPYIGKYAAHGIVVFREHNLVEDWTVENLDKAGILREGMGEKLAKCRLEREVK